MNTWDSTLAGELKLRGWAVVPAPDDSHYAPWYAYRSPTGDCARCSHSDSAPRLVLSKWTIEGSNAATMSLRGASGGVWYELSASALEISSLLTRLDEVSTKLVNGWTALAKSAKPAAADIGLSGSPSTLSVNARDALTWISCAASNLARGEARLRIIEMFGSDADHELKEFFGYKDS